MANAFKNKTQRQIGTSLTAIESYTVPVSPATETTVIGLTIANTTTVAIEVDATLNDGTNDFYMTILPWDVHPDRDKKWFDKLEKKEVAEEDMLDMAFEPSKFSRLTCQITATDDLDGLVVKMPSKQG